MTNSIKGTLTIRGIVASLVPDNYFVVLYIVVYLLSPYLNLVYDKVNNNFMLLLFFVFSVYPTLVDWFNKITGKEWFGLSSIGLQGSQDGYQIVNFIMMYYVGMYINKNIEQIKKIKVIKLAILMISLVIIIAMMACECEMLGFGMYTAWSYCNPLIVLESALAFVIFTKIDIGSVKYINKLSVASFTVYLTHCNKITN